MALLDHICVSGDQSTIDGYMIHSHQFQSSKPTSAFWALQTSIVTQLHTIRSLSLFVVFVHPDHNSSSNLHFINNLSQTGSVTPSMHMELTYYENKIVRHTTVIVGINNSAESSVENSTSKLYPANYHYVLIPSFYKTSTKWKM